MAKAQPVTAAPAKRRSPTKVAAAAQQAVQPTGELGVDRDLMLKLNAVVVGFPVLEGELLRRSFHRFVKAAWHILEPGTELKDNWHMKAICDHLEAVARGEIQRLIINMPPRFAKSMLVSVLWPAWIWATFPEKRFLTSSYSKDLATRDAVASRRLMESQWYRERFGHVFRFTSDQNVKTRYENNKRGYRVTTSVGATATGEGGDILLVDDPINSLEARSDSALKTAVTWWRETMSSRYNDPATGAAVIVMQRLHENDLTGFLLSDQPGLWEHLVFPMRFEPKVTKTTKLGFKDPRKKEGELLFPARFNEASTARLEKELGSYGTAGQLQQRPAPAEGGIFQRSDWQYYTVLPQLDEVVISVDCAFKGANDSDFVAIHAWGRKGANKYLIHRVNEQMGFSATVKAVKAVKAKFPHAIAILIEDKANGPAVIDTLKGEIAGLIPIEPEGGKTVRAWAMQPEHEAGNIFLPDPSIDPKIEDFINNAASFPNVVHDDEIDAMTQYVNWQRTRQGSNGLFDYYKQQAQDQQSAQRVEGQSQKQSPQDFVRAMS